MYLTKIELSLFEPGIRAAMRDSQIMHRHIAGLYRTPRSENAVLYRVRALGSVAEVFLYAASPILRESLLPGMTLAGERDLTTWLEQMDAGQLWHFDLMTMPFKKVAGSSGQNSRRRVLRSGEERFAWLTRKAEQNGFEILDVQESASGKINASHAEERGGKLYMDAYRYSGLLRITDGTLFRDAVQGGIGPGKAYGLGMLLLRR